MESFKCDRCGTCFVKKCGLASHLRKHENARLDCAGCHFVADDKATLEQHRQTCEFIDRTAAPSMSVSQTPKPPEPDLEPIQRIRRKVNLAFPTPLFTKTAKNQGVNENSAPTTSSRKVSFLLPKSEPKPKVPILSTPKPPKSVKSPRTPILTEKKEDEEAPGKESTDAYFPLPPGSIWAPPGGDPGFPARVEMDLNTPLMEDSKNRFCPSWLAFVENPVNNFVRPKPVEPEKDPLKPPKFEDFLKIPGCYGQERHPIEARDLHERALEKYNREMKARKFGQTSHLPVREYLKRKAEIEESRECPDCAYKKSDLTKFRAHRDRHELGGLFKCSECNYGSHSPLITNNHKFFDHFLSDVKVLEGLPSSDSEEEVEEGIQLQPHVQEFMPTPASPKKKCRRRRRNW